MEATPAQYREDIARTREAIVQIDAELAPLYHFLSERPERMRYAYTAPMTAQEERRAALVRQLAALEQGLARAERLWAQHQAQQGAGTQAGEGR